MSDSSLSAPRRPGDWRVLIRLGPFLRPYVGRISIALLCLVAAKAAGLSVPLLLRSLVDGLNGVPPGKQSVSIPGPPAEKSPYGQRYPTEAGGGLLR